MMQVVVLMGGLGTRLGEQTEHCPKTLVDVNGKPFFEYQFELMIKAGFDKFLFCVGYNATMIESYFGDGSKWNVKIQYSYDGEIQLGTGGAIVNALPLLEDDFLLIYGDSFMDVDYNDIISKYHPPAMMTILHNENQFDKSNVIYYDNQIITYSKIYEPEMKYIDYGISIFNKKVFETYDNAYFDLTEVYQNLIKQHLLAGCPVYNRFYEIGTPESLNEFKEYMRRTNGSI